MLLGLKFGSGEFYVQNRTDLVNKIALKLTVDQVHVLFLISKLRKFCGIMHLKFSGFNNSFFIGKYLFDNFLIYLNIYRYT